MIIGSRSIGNLGFVHDQKGVSFIELLLAVLIVSVGLVGYMTAVNYSLKSVRESLFATQATTHARNLAELSRIIPEGWGSVGAPTVDCKIAECATPADMISYYVGLASCSLNPIDNPNDFCEQESAGGVRAQVTALPNAALSVSESQSTLVVINGTNWTRRTVQFNVNWGDSISQWDNETGNWAAASDAGAGDGDGDGGDGDGSENVAAVGRRGISVFAVTFSQ